MFSDQKKTKKNKQKNPTRKNKTKQQNNPEKLVFKMK